MSDISNHLAVDRTRLAYERTLMAWIRTATSLISFGFTIYKFFQFEHEKDPMARHHLLGPRQFAMLMIGSGILALTISTVQHWQSMRTLQREYGKTPFSAAMAVAGLISILGIAALLAVIYHQ